MIERLKDFRLLAAVAPFDWGLAIESVGTFHSLHIGPLALAIEWPAWRKGGKP